MLATDLGLVAFVSPLLDGRWCNRGVKQSASGLPLSNLMCGRGSWTASSRPSGVRSVLRKVGAIIGTRRSTRAGVTSNCSTARSSGPRPRVASIERFPAVRPRLLGCPACRRLAHGLPRIFHGTGSNAQKLPL